MGEPVSGVSRGEEVTNGAPLVGPTERLPESTPGTSFFPLQMGSFLGVGVFPSDREGSAGRSVFTGRSCWIHTESQGRGPFSRSPRSPSEVTPSS